jgi:ketol-acid reductoisomerase
MPNKKLTDNEIIKALELLLELVLVEGCSQRAKTISNALDLINRQKAEIERLNSRKEVVVPSMRLIDGNPLNGFILESHRCVARTIEDVKAEAYKECIEKVKKEINKHSYDMLSKTVINYKLDNLLKEMVGDDK